MWFHKSRCEWLKYGDKNTNYFHGTIVFRRKHQNMVQDSNGFWVNGPDQLKNMVISYFQELYKDSSTNTPFSVRGCFPSLSNRDVGRLSVDVLIPEFCRALFDMGRLKALGPYGYHVVFF